MLKILWKRGEIAPEEQFLLLSTIFCYLMLDFYVKIRIRFSLRDKRLLKITEVEITRVDCILILNSILLRLYRNVNELKKHRVFESADASVLWSYSGAWGGGWEDGPQKPLSMNNHLPASFRSVPVNVLLRWWPN